MQEAPCGGDYEIEFFSLKTAPVSEYTADIRFDMRDIMYCDAVSDVADWWDKVNSLPRVYVPKNATMPVYSTWYNFHQNIKDNEMIEECKKAYEYGMRTIIIDDGWQTENSSGGYAYCGIMHTDKEINVKYKRYNCVGDIVEEKGNLILNGDYRILTTPSDVLEFDVIK